MSTNELLNLLREIQENEKEAERLYSRYLEELRDEEIVKALRHILDEETRHVRLASEAVSLVKHGSAYLKIRNSLADFSESATCFVSSGIESYTRNSLAMLEHLINERGMRCVYVAVNRPSTSLAEVYRREDIDTEAITFIDCSTVEIGQPGITVVSPENLTDISMAIARHAERHPSKGFVYFDTVSALYIYHPSNMVERFIHNLIPRLKAVPIGLIMVIIEEEVEQRVRAVLTAFSDIKIAF